MKRLLCLLPLLWWAPAGALAAGLSEDVTVLVELPALATPEDDESLPFKLSLPTQADAEAWREPGMRLFLGVKYGYFQGLLGVPSGLERLATYYPGGVVARVGRRLDADWSLLGSFQYGGVFEVGGINGLRYSGTIDPTWHIDDHWDVSLGVGFGGLVETTGGRANPDAQRSAQLVATYTHPNARYPVQSCSGLGVTGLARVQWLTVIGSLATTGFALEAAGQWTRCVSGTNNVEPDTAKSITIRQWWPSLMYSVGWMVGWR
jgi:hypothetical protein